MTNYKNTDNERIIELSVATSLQEKAVTRIAIESNTICFEFMGRKMRSTFYRNNIDWTIKGVLAKAQLIHEMRKAPGNNYKDDFDILQPIVEQIEANWIELSRLKRGS